MFTGYCDVRAFPRRMKRKSRDLYDRVSSISRASVDDEVEEVTVEFEAGGRLIIFTDRPLLWVDPKLN